jgi:uncharacterized membrane protein YqaE (UPF0057 family)
MDVRETVCKAPLRRGFLLPAFFVVSGFGRSAASLIVFSLNPDERSWVNELYGNVAIANQESSMDIIRIIIAILLPPLGVFLQVGFGGAFWLNILLTLLGYIPGIVHAVYIIAKR